MSKFNTKSVGTKTTNYMGGVSFKMGAESELVGAVLTTFMDDKYYESANGRMSRISALVGECSPSFVVKLAYVARNEFYMRSTPVALLGELIRQRRGSDLIKNAIEKVVARVDDITELVAYLGGKLSKQAKRGIRHALLKFSPYQLAKYKGEGKSVKLVDVFNLVHPNPKFATKEQQLAWKKLMTGKLVGKDTWEVVISASKDKKKDWSNLVKKDKLGYMALLRNLNNLIKNDVGPKVMDIVLKKLSDKESVLKSKQLPFRFLSAFEAVTSKESSCIMFEKSAGYTEKVRKTLGIALSYSIENIELLKGTTAILTDNSGSMRGDCGGESLVSRLSNRKNADIANLFAVLTWMRSDNTYVGVFGDELESPKLDRKEDVFFNFKQIDTVGSHIGGGTEMGLFTFMRKIIADKTMVDRIVIFSDCQVGKRAKWYGTSPGECASDFNALLEAYKKINPKVWVFSVDLQGYGTQMIAGRQALLFGWSDKLLTFISKIERGNEMVDYINSIVI